MSDQAAEVTAAATGAAAAVAAVQDDQAEAERAAAVELDAAVATDAATLAAQQAQDAADAAEAASDAATQAVSTATSASDTATQAAEEAYDARAHVETLRTEFSQGLQSLRQHLDETFGSKRPTDEPTEVIVTSERTQSAETGTTHTGGDTAPGGGTERPRRHRFGR